MAAVDLHKQRVPAVEQTPITVVSNTINTIVGASATVLVKPANAGLM
jgi:hypothetical protein